MKDLMIDIETLGTGQNAVVIAIGARLFDAETGEFGDSFYTKIDYQDQVDFGRKVTESTINWWMIQGEAAKKVFNEEGADTSTALKDLFNFCRKVKDIRPWGNGPSFDLAIMENLFIDFGYPSFPWSFRNVRCLRTFKDYIYDGKDLTREGIHHHGLDDADHQARIVIEGIKRKKQNK